MRTRSYLACIAALVGGLTIAACDGGGDDPPEQAALDSAVTTWTGVAADHYMFVSQRACECLPEVGMPILVEVMDDAIAGAVYEADSQPVSPEVLSTLNTIDGLFGIIQAAIDEGAYSVEVTYDGDNGVPESINIDYDQATADEEFYLDIRDFEIIDGPSI